ncbi:MAG: hypothetical protein L0213_13760, partial [Candidatus Dadabacteria bacterium]|nr:hypothetical protein [Candidatus Dadabacteria bacterium]
MTHTISLPPAGRRIPDSSKFKVICMLFIVYLFLFPVISSASQEHKEFNTPPDTDRPTTVDIGLYLLDFIYLDQPKQLLRARYALSLHW